MVPNVYDPSELRVDENGPVVCSLHEESTENATGNTIVVPGAGTGGGVGSIIFT